MQYIIIRARDKAPTSASQSSILYRHFQALRNIPRSSNETLIPHHSCAAPSWSGIVENPYVKTTANVQSLTAPKCKHGTSRRSPLVP